ncbi:hypothetical protein JN06_02640 [Bacteroides zoogleoformans]|uniref:hypothetical protein n=1 Tax=Bacteroides zoogleoformans TaxID=28119 RepID=UPI0011AB9919|nr:hypothetical protein [Bacteroides zoogleoformans]TWJ10915.1 hypothetical protein JN06_02640 [Bacteroides zoogleoformans]
MKKIDSVCVYCASGTKTNPAYFNAARKTDTLSGRKRLRLIYTFLLWNISIRKSEAI